MLKLRIHGELKEIEEALKLIPKSFKVLQESEAYKDNGKSEYHRVYLDVELKKRRVKENGSLD